jgi:hypothetical protein
MTVNEMQQGKDIIIIILLAGDECFVSFYDAFFIFSLPPCDLWRLKRPNPPPR